MYVAANSLPEYKHPTNFPDAQTGFRFQAFLLANPDGDRVIWTEIRIANRMAQGSREGDRPMIQFRCPDCRVKLAVTPDLIKKQITCPKCQGKVVVPTKSEEPSKPAPKTSAVKAKAPPTRVAAKIPVLDEVEEVDDLDEIDDSPRKSRKSAKRREDEEDSVDEDFSRRKRKNQKQESGSPVLLIAGIGGGGALLLVIGVLVYFLGFRSAAPPPVAKVQNPPPQVKLVPQPQPAAQPAPPAPPRVEVPVVVAKQPDEPIQAADPILKQKAPDEITSDMVRKLKKATVYIKVTNAAGQTGSGTGFFALQPGLIITNAHVLNMRTSRTPPKSVMIHTDSGEASEASSPAAILSVDRENDLAILRIQNPPAVMPDPIPVEQTLRLTELQKVYIFGFPFGESIGKNITISSSSVSSIRKDANGEIENVQVNGGMNPGNSGGPVVDARGVVIGVAVSGLIGTNINFAVPSEKIRNLVDGRLDQFAFGEPFRVDGVVKSTAAMKVQDPLNRIKSYSLDVWQGPKDRLRPQSRSLPTAWPGDGPKESFPIQIDDEGRGKADVPVPGIIAGKALWAQLRMTDAAGKSRWGAAYAFTGNVSSPLDRIEAKLKLESAEPIRTVQLITKKIIRVPNGKEEFELSLATEVEALETVASGAKASHVFNIIKYTTKEELKGPKNLRKSISNSQGESFIKTVPYKYDFATNGAPTRGKGFLLGGYSPANRKLLDDLAASFEFSFISVADKLVQPGEQWNSNSKVSVGYTGANDKHRRLTLDVSVTCTYEGIRDKDGAPQADIRLEGGAELARKREGGGGVVGKVSGHMLVDLKKGFVSKVHFRLGSDSDEGVSTDVIEMIRTPGNPKGIVPAKTPEPVAKVILNKKATITTSDPIDNVRNAGAHHHVHEVDLQAGKVYYIEMRVANNSAIDPYLTLNGVRGKIAEDDDSGGDLDARIIFRAPTPGKYKIHATTCNPDDVGEYVITVTEFADSNPSDPITPKTMPTKKGLPKKS